jgi:ubiquinone/menaquinone biosynthesis C-methylase UbiE
MTERPIPSEKYDRQYFEKLNKGYREFVLREQFHPAYYQALDFVGLQGGERVLDLGCGRGELVYLTALRGCECVGIDFSSAAVEMARDLLQTLPENFREKADIRQMDVKQLNFADEVFDAVFMLDIVEHLHPWELKAALAEAARVLRPEGRLLIYTSPNKISLGPVRFLAHRVGITFRSDEFHVNEQSFFTLKKYLSDEFTIKKFWMQKHRNYWFNGVPERGAVVKLVARVVDGFLDNPLSEFLITRTFLQYFLGTGIWIVANPRKR